MTKSISDLYAAYSYAKEKAKETRATFELMKDEIHKERYFKQRDAILTDINKWDKITRLLDSQLESVIHQLALPAITTSVTPS